MWQYFKWHFFLTRQHFFKSFCYYIQYQIRLEHGIRYMCVYIYICDRLDYTYSCVYVSKTMFFFSFFFFFFFQPQQLTLSTVNSASVHCLRSHKVHFSATFLLKMGPTALFTHLKIISLQCFQFQFSISAKISLIQTHPLLRSFKEASFFTLKPSAQTKKQKTTKAKVQRRRETVEKKALLLLCYWFFFFFFLEEFEKQKRSGQYIR